MNNAKNIYSKKLEAENARKMAQHRRNLATMSSCVDNKPPKQYSHLKRNLKKEALMEERFAGIERDNRLLLEKMSFIIRHSSIDNKLGHQYQNFRSLNQDGRKKELLRITRDNAKLLRRIQHAEPAYDHLAWAEDDKKHQELLKNLCEHPVILGQPQKSVSLPALGTQAGQL